MKALSWSPAALRDLRRLDPPVARQVRDAVIRYAETGSGNVAPLHRPLAGLLRLRLRDWRIFLRPGSGSLLVVAVEKREEPYR